MKYSAVLFSFAIFFCCSGLAQNSATDLYPDRELIEYNIDNWTKENGLPSNEILDICQTDDGFIWISAYSGLIRFDGIDFKIYNTLNTSVFEGNGTGALATDHEGTLWITTQSSGLVSYKEGMFRANFANADNKYLKSVIFIDSKDRIWSESANSGWFFFDKKDFRFLNPPSKSQITDLKSIAETTDGSIWFGTGGDGLFKFNFENNKFDVFTTNNGLISNWIRSLYVDDDGLLWIGTDKGICYFNGNCFKTIEELKGIAVNDIIQEKNGNYWFSTPKGLFKKNVLLNKFERLSTSNGLNNNDINNLMFDFENSLWIINYKAGLTRIKNDKFISYTLKKGLSGKIANSVCEYKPGTYLIGLNNGKIDVITKGRITEFHTKFPLTGKRIRHIFKDSKGNLWISTYSGLLKISASGKETWYSESNGFPGNYIRLAFEDSQGNIWIATRNSGLIRLNKNNAYTVFDKTNGLSSNLITSISEDKKNNIVVGTSEGGINIISNDTIINVYSKNNGLPGEIVFNTYIDSVNNIWVASNMGLSLISGKEIFTYELEGNEISFVPLDILDDDKGNFWFPSQNGIIKLSKKSLEDYKAKKTNLINYKIYNENDGIVQAECTSAGYSLKASNGTLWFPTINGVATIDPNMLRLNDYLPPVYIEELIVNNLPVNLSDKIIIEPGNNRFVFSFTALSLHEPQNVRFKYKLEGFEDTWSKADTKRTVSYTNIPHGSYTFKVIACNNDGLWNTTGDVISFTVEPHFYQTGFFYAGVAIFIFCIIYLIIRIRVRSLKTEQKKLENIVRERTNELSKKNLELINYQNHLEEMIKERTNDLELAKLNAEKADRLKTSFLENLSHEIRTPLNAIVGFSAILDTDEKLSENSKESIINIMAGSSSLTRIVDSIMQASRLQLGDIELFESEFSLFDLTEELFKEFNNSGTLKKKENLSLRFNAEDVKTVKITCDRDRLQTILYNLLDNAVKFTEKGYVEFGVSLENDDLLRFYVKDTGIGIAEEDQAYIFDKFRKIETDKSVLYRGLGLGLNISKSLVNMLGGKISVKSSPGEGSVFEFQIPVKNLKKTEISKKTGEPDFLGLNISGKKILIAEDEQYNMQFLIALLKRSGAYLLTAKNGIEAVDAVKNHDDIDLILMDIKMPELDGIEATKQIRKLNHTEHIKIIAQTAYTLNYQKNIILKSGFDDYIEKPINVKIITNLINKYLIKYT